MRDKEKERENEVRKDLTFCRVLMEKLVARASTNYKRTVLQADIRRLRRELSEIMDKLDGVWW